MTESLDQFFTKKEVAVSCIQKTMDILVDEFKMVTGHAHGDITSGSYAYNAQNLQSVVFIEPSCGNLDFYNHLPYQKIGIDIDKVTSRLDIVHSDFVDWTLNPSLRDKRTIVCIGNPPFGRNGKIAMRFLMHATEFSDFIAFILPMSFRKFRVQKLIPEEWMLISEERLSPHSFYTKNGRNISMNTVFQIWTTRLGMKDLRRAIPEPITHPDFYIWQYNATHSSMHMFDQPFDFAVPCQGWQDYSRRETEPEHCEKKKQWMFFKPRNDDIREKLINFDFEELASTSGTVVPGFRKSDFVKAYKEKYDS